MTIESDITAWALERPGWQQEVLVSLANGEQLTDDQIESLVDQILQPNSGSRTDHLP